MKKKIYLAIPYTWNPTVSERIANKTAALLMKQGHVVFSPISHSHAIADEMEESLRLDHHFWMNQDLPFIDWADEVIVVCIGEMGHELIENSRGVQAELKYAKEHHKPVHVMTYYHENFEAQANSINAFLPVA